MSSWWVLGLAVLVIKGDLLTKNHWKFKNPSTTYDKCTHHAILTACYHLAQSVLQIPYNLICTPPFSGRNANLYTLIDHTHKMKYYYSIVCITEACLDINTVSWFKYGESFSKLTNASKQVFLVLGCDKVTRDDVEIVKPQLTLWWHRVVHWLN